MTFPRTLAAATAALALFSGAAGKPTMTVRFYAEAKEMDGERFATPVKLQFPPREAFIEKSPTISERQIRGIYPFAAPNGTFGCLFRLDGSGTLALSTTSMDKRGSSLVAYVGTKKGTHQVIDMVIDKPVTDGFISIQQGLTPVEIALLKKQFRPIEPAKKPR